MFGIEGEKVYQKVVRRMAETGLSIDEVAQKGGLSKQTIYGLNKRQMILPLTIHKLAKGLDLSIDFFFEN